MYIIVKKQVVLRWGEAANRHIYLRRLINGPQVHEKCWMSLRRAMIIKTARENITSYLYKIESTVMTILNNIFPNLYIIQSSYQIIFPHTKTAVRWWICPLVYIFLKFISLYMYNINMCVCINILLHTSNCPRSNILSNLKVN